MRFPTKSLLALVSVVLVVARPEAGRGLTNLEPLTNAKRFAAGLPPLPPGSLYRDRGLGSGSKIDSARRATVSPSPRVTLKCNPFLKMTRGGEITTAYLSPEWSYLGSYAVLQPGQTGALEVSFSYIPDDPSSYSGLNLLVTSPPNPVYPWFGATAVDRNNYDMGSSIINYGTISGTAKTEKGAPAAIVGGSADVESIRGTESAIWNYDPSTGKLTAQWVNNDGSAPVTSLIYIPEYQFISTSNQAIIFGQYRLARSVEMTCVPPVAA